MMSTERLGMNAEGRTTIHCLLLRVRYLKCKGEGGEKCQTCGSQFQKWKFENCEHDCDIRLCKKCTAKCYKEEQKDECISCFEII